MIAGEPGRVSVAIRVLRLPHGEGLPLPSYHSEHAAGLDVVAGLAEDEPLELAPGARVLVPTGFALELPPGYEAQLRPRSGLALKAGVTLLNSPGTIDADYRGLINIILINFGTQPFVIKRGMRIAQMVINHVTRAHLQVVEELDATARNTGGFGHTGV